MLALACPLRWGWLCQRVQAPQWWGCFDKHGIAPQWWGSTTEESSVVVGVCLHKIIRQRNAKKLIVPNLAAVRAGAAKV